MPKDTRGIKHAKPARTRSSTRAAPLTLRSSTASVILLLRSVEHWTEPRTSPSQSLPQCEPWITVSPIPMLNCWNEIERSRGGPAHAMYYNRVTLIPTTLHDRNWPEYSLQCQRQRIGSVAAFPIEVDGERAGC